jgi:hypothetical protein
MWCDTRYIYICTSSGTVKRAPPIPIDLGISKRRPRRSESLLLDYVYGGGIVGLFWKRRRCERFGPHPRFKKVIPLGRKKSAKHSGGVADLADYRSHHGFC